MRCDGCRAEVDAQRRLKSQLARLAPPPVSGDLAGRLLSIPERTPAPAAVGMPTARFEARFRAPARVGGDASATGDRVLAPRNQPRLAAPVLIRTPERAPASRPVSTPAARRPGQRPRQRRRLAVTAAGGLAAFALSLAAVAAVGALDEPPAVAPQIGTFITEHDRGTEGMPGSDQEVGVVDATSTGR